MRLFKEKMPAWGPDLSGIDFANIHYYIRPQDRVKRDWKRFAGGN